MHPLSVVFCGIMQNYTALALLFFKETKFKVNSLFCFMSTTTFLSLKKALSTIILNLHSLIIAKSYSIRFCVQQNRQ
jgi:hypothetical protein